MISRASLSISALLFSAAALSVRADVRVPALFGDHMVLQQEATIPVWGWADPGEIVTVRFAGQSVTAKADAAGDWRVSLTRLPADATSRTLTIKGRNEIVIQDVIVGEVWLCSGQSNMEFQMFRGVTPDSGAGASGGPHDVAETLPKASDPQLRLFHVKRSTSFTPLKDVEGRWKVCTPENVKDFSAIGYYFGRDLRAHAKRPVGMIQAAWGATAVQSWTNFAWLRAHPEQSPEAAQWGKENDAFAKKAQEADIAAKAQTDGQPAADDSSVRRIHVGTLYNGMIAPLAPYALRGVLWYQGEAHASNDNWNRYERWFTNLITSWRDAWGRPDMPFLYVQIAAYANRHTPDQLVQGFGHAPGVREGQRQALKLPNTGMATAIDLGEVKNVHPADKADVAARLLLSARHVAYGEDVVYSGPDFQSLQIEGGKIRVKFKYADGGLKIGTPPWIGKTGLKPPTDKLEGFAIAGEDKKFVWAEAHIEGDTVIVSSEQVAKPVAVRYGWANYPTVNLYNKENLPAVPFRSDDW